MRTWFHNSREKNETFGYLTNLHIYQPAYIQQTVMWFLHLYLNSKHPFRPVSSLSGTLGLSDEPCVLPHRIQTSVACRSVRSWISNSGIKQTWILKANVAKESGIAATEPREEHYLHSS